LDVGVSNRSEIDLELKFRIVENKNKSWSCSSLRKQRFHPERTIEL
jgi:hypothetical protein